MYVSMYGPVHVSTGALESQGMMLEPLELDLHEVMSCPTRVLEAELGSSTKAIDKANSQPVFYLSLDFDCICYLASSSIQMPYNMHRDDIQLDITC